MYFVLSGYPPAAASRFGFADPHSRPRLPHPGRDTLAPQPASFIHLGERRGYSLPRRTRIFAECTRSGLVFGRVVRGLREGRRRFRAADNKTAADVTWHAGGWSNPIKQVTQLRAVFLFLSGPSHKRRRLANRRRFARLKRGGAGPARGPDHRRSAAVGRRLRLAGACESPAPESCSLRGDCKDPIR